MSREAFEKWADGECFDIPAWRESLWEAWSARDAEVAELKAKIGELEAERVVNSAIASDRDARIAELGEELNAIYEADAGVGI